MDGSHDNTLSAMLYQEVSSGNRIESTSICERKLLRGLGMGGSMDVGVADALQQAILFLKCSNK